MNIVGAIYSEEEEEDEQLSPFDTVVTCEFPHLNRATIINIKSTIAYAQIDSINLFVKPPQMIR